MPRVSCDRPRRSDAAGDAAGRVRGVPRRLPAGRTGGARLPDAAAAGVQPCRARQDRLPQLSRRRPGRPRDAGAAAGDVVVLRLSRPRGRRRAEPLQRLPPRQARRHDPDRVPDRRARAARRRPRRRPQRRVLARPQAGGPAGRRDVQRLPRPVGVRRLSRRRRQAGRLPRRRLPVHPSPSTPAAAAPTARRATAPSRSASVATSAAA